MKTESASGLSTAYTFLDRLDASHIPYRLDRVRDALMISFATPGERWEVEFFEDGHVEVERFRSDGEISGFDALERVFQS